MQYAVVAMMTSRSLFAVVPVLVLLGAPVAQKQQSRTQPQLPTLRATTRLVLVDVIVTDDENRPVADLQASDFVVLEDGKPQKIATFARLPEQDKPPAPPPSPLPADLYTNDPRYRAVTGTPIIMLLDLLNTPSADRPRIRLAMIDFIRKHLRPGQATAVFLLGRKLELLQNFTDDPRILLAAVDRITGNPRESVADHTTSDMIQRAIDRAKPDQLAQLEHILEIAQRFESAYQIAAATDHAATLLQAVTAIARAAWSIPGRKSMIWVSAGLPVQVKRGDVAAYYPTSQEVVSFTDLLARIADSLNEAQIAIYPVDIRGLNTTAPLWGDTSLRTDRYSRARSRNDSPVTSEQTAELESYQDSLARIAAQTGGRVFLNRNDADVAIALAAKDGEHYYTIGYYAEDRRWNGGFRKIELKVARKGLHLRHRTGYFAEDSATSRARAEWDLANALRYDPLTTARVVFSARATLAVPGQVDVEFMLPPASIHFEQQNGLYVGSMDFHVAALTNDDKVATSAAKTSNFSLDPQKYSQVMSFSSLTDSVPLALSPGKYRVRLLIRDNLTGNLGTVEIPITVPKK